MVLSPSLEPMSLSPDPTNFANSAEDTMDVEQAFPVASGIGQDREQHIGQDLIVDSNFAGTLVAFSDSDDEMNSENVENSLASGSASILEAGPSMTSAAEMTFINSGLHDMGSINSTLCQTELQSVWAIL